MMKLLIPIVKMPKIRFNLNNITKVFSNDHCMYIIIALIMCMQ